MSTDIFYAYVSSAVTSKPALDAVNERMLNALAVKWSSSNTLVTVKQAMFILPEISPTTAHRRLKEMRKSGWIGLKRDLKDGRIKYVIPTKSTQSHFTNLGELMSLAVVEGGASK